MLQLIENLDVYLSSLTADLANSQVGLDFHLLNFCCIPTISCFTTLLALIGVIC